MQEFRRALIANRGEISVRIIRALEALGIESVAVYSDVDIGSMYVTMADKAFHLQGVYAKDTYLDAKKIVEIARKSDCDAIHPGYGFLAESGEFSKLCKDASIKFIGPGPETLAISGNKFECKKLVERLGVPVIPYSKEPIQDANEASRFASELGFPVLLKSAFGGGGRGIKEARSKQEVRDAFESSEREAKAAFGRFAVFVEKKLQKPRHIEIQVLASDDSSEFVHLGERECSIQRRYQKLVEISPSPVVDEETRGKVSGYALKAARAVKYSNAGTVEFLRDSESGNFYFIEINSRLQVEHPVTETVCGVDLVRAQLEISSSNKIPFKQQDIVFRGCAIECRINAEDPLAGFAPVSGKIEHLHVPSGPGIRVDTALYEGVEISPYYDSLIAKLIAWGENFESARRRAIVALNEFAIYGIETTIPFHQEVMIDPKFARGDLNTLFIEESGVIERLSKKTVSDFDKFAMAALLLSKNQLTKCAALTQQAETRRPKILGAGGRFVDAL